MFVTPAYAQAAGEAAGPGALQAFLPIILIFVVFYFLLIRPQQKKMKQHKEMLAAVRRGDRIVTGGGIIGTVIKVVDDNEVVAEIAEGVRVRVQRGLISTVLSKTEPVGESRPPKGSADDAKTMKEGAGEGPRSGPPVSTTSKVKRLFGGKGD
ncbi:MAG: preprotein translocase subunit YajC [Rhodospirillales bacterium]